MGRLGVRPIGGKRENFSVSIWIGAAAPFTEMIRFVEDDDEAMFVWPGESVEEIEVTDDFATSRNSPTVMFAVKTTDETDDGVDFELGGSVKSGLPFVVFV